MRRAWPVWLLAPALIVACTTSPETTAPSITPLVDGTNRPAARLTVAMLREADLQRQETAVAPDGQDVPQDLTPSTGDVLGLGGGVLGDVAAGLPGGVALGFSGQVAGGNNVGKAVGSTLGALLGSLLGPVGGMVGSVAGGYAGKQIDKGAVDNPAATVDFGPAYIEGMDTGPLAAMPGERPASPNET